MAENVTNNEAKTQSSLMKKTKVQLVDIILRKDSVERELRDVVKQHKEDLEALRENCDAHVIRFKQLTDENTKNNRLVKELTNKVNIYKRRVSDCKYCIIGLTILAVILLFI